MRRVRTKLLVMTGLFISGINSSLANNITTIHSESDKTSQLKKYLSLPNREFLYELKHPEDLSLPSYSREVLVKSYQKIKLEKLENILLNNNHTIKIFIGC